MLLSLLRTLIMYAVILLGVRIMGKRQISQLQTSELVVTFLISELAVIPIENPESPLWTGLSPMAALILCEILVSFLMLKRGSFRKLICGKPVIIIEDGKILQEQMRKLRMSTEELFEQLRQNGVFSLEEVAYAVIETNGMMSVSRHAKEDALTPRQCGIEVEEEYLEVVVVSDGEISKSSLKLCGKTPEWVGERLKGRGIEVKDVFIMTARLNGDYKIILKENRNLKRSSKQRN